MEGYAQNLWRDRDTTEGLVISGKNLSIQGNNKNVTIVNVSQNDRIENNGGLYATNGSKINFNNLQNVYIAAIGGKEERNDSTAISAKLFGNKVSVSGDTVRLIGSLDVTGWGNQIEVSMSGKNSFGTVANAVDPYQKLQYLLQIKLHGFSMQTNLHTIKKDN